MLRSPLVAYILLLCGFAMTIPTLFVGLDHLCPDHPLQLTMEPETIALTILAIIFFTYSYVLYPKKSC